MRFSKELFLADPTAGPIVGLSDVVQKKMLSPHLQSLPHATETWALKTNYSKISESGEFEGTGRYLTPFGHGIIVAVIPASVASNNLGFTW